MSLGYDIIVYKDLSAKRIRKNIKELVESDFEGYASLIVCLLSHGEEGTIFGSDWLPVRINDLKFAFNSHDCPSLHGKPKIFIVQACQGYSYQTPYEEGSKKFQTLPSPKSEPVTKSEADTVPISPPAYSASWKGPDQQKNPSNSLQHNQQTLTHPPIMDLFDIIATIPEHVSFRDTEQGELRHLFRFFIKFLLKMVSFRFLFDSELVRQTSRGVRGSCGSRGPEGVELHFERRTD